MSVIEDLKKERVAALKAGDKDTATFLSYVIGTLDAIGKNAGNRDTTDDEAIAAIKKIIQKNQEVLDVTNSEKTSLELIKQNDTLEKYLPKMVSEGELKSFIENIQVDKPVKGMYMKEVKAKYGQAVDMKLAGSIIDTILSKE